MASTIFFMESANLFCGDADPTDSKHLSLESVKLPDLKATFAEHNAGGSPVAIEVQVGIDKLEPSFKLKGYDPKLLSQFGYGSTTRTLFTIYGVMRDLRSGEAKEGMTIIEGRLGKVAPDEYKRGELSGNDYTINEVVHYEIHFDGAEILWWDFFTGTWRVNGTVANSRERSLLRLPT